MKLGTDWRGVDIVVGSTVVYSAAIGKTAQPVEGVAIDVYPSKKIKLNVVRRSGSYVWSGAKSVVAVDPDKVTVVTGLPVSSKPTQERMLEMNKNRHSHTVRWSADGSGGRRADCSKCLNPGWDLLGESPCPISP